MTLPAKPILQALGSIPSATFVETGSYHGSGIHIAIQSGFTKIISIEPVKEFFDICAEKFSSQIKNGSVELVLGSSEQKLGEVIGKIDTPIVYWLDGHYQGGESEAKNCPLADEVSAIIGRGVGASDVIMIDDIRLLKVSSAWRGHETDLASELGKLIISSPGHMGLFVRGHIAADVFLLVPRWLVGAHPSIFDRQLNQ